MKKYKYIVGIDPGTHCGLAVWNCEIRQLETVDCAGIHIIMAWLNDWPQVYSAFYRVEDARQRKWFGNTGRERLKGAGSVERDCSIWDDFLNDLGVAYEMVAPKNNKTKMNAAAFKQLTGWKASTNEHGRDAAMLVYGHNGLVAALEAQK